MEKFPKTKRLTADSSLSLPGGLGRHIMPKQDVTECKLQTYRGTNLAYDMFCDPISLYNKDK